MADGREYVCPSQRWRFIENLIKDELIYDFMALMARASNFELGTVQETEELCKKALEKFGFKSIPGRNKVFVTRQYVEEFIRVLCLINCYKKRATAELIMKVVNREYFFEGCSEMYTYALVKKELQKHPEEGQEFNR